jgi:alkylation response protein AidB-like acyl-CoA dehydrogenase
LENCKIPVNNLIGKEGEGFKIAMKALDGGRVNIGGIGMQLPH